MNELIETSQPTRTPGAKERQTVGEHIESQVKNYFGEVLPKPGDYKALDTEKYRHLRAIRAHQAPVNDTEKAVHQYLQSIGISLETAEALHLGYQQMDFFRSEDEKVNLPALAYVFTVEQRVVNVKYRSCASLPSVQSGTPVTYTKDWHQVTSQSELGISPCFIDTLRPAALNGQRVAQFILTEGEKDCLALYEAGFRHFCSVPTGASSEPEKYLAAFAEWFQAVDSVVICGDTDFPGRRMVYALCEFFGTHACVVDLPDDCKDIADVLVKHGKEAVQRILRNAHPRYTKAIQTIADETEDILAIARNQYDHGYSVGYGPLTDRVFHPDHTGGLIVISGQPNCGKSDFINDLMLRLMTCQHKKVLFLSFENPNKPKHTAHFLQLLHESTDLSHLDRTELLNDIGFLHQHMAHLDLTNEPRTPEHILHLADQYRRLQGLDYFVIDPYLFIDFKPQKKNESETESIKRMLTLFQQWGQLYHIWVCIVAHPRKTQTARGGFTSDDVSPDDIASSAHWKNLADFLFVIKRVNTDEEKYTEMHMIKVRDQSLCSPGRAYFVRTQSGNYIEKPSPAACRDWYADQKRRFR